MIHLGMHTDNWRPLSGSFEQAIESARKNDLEYIEFGVIDGQNFIEGLGYDPAVSLEDSPVRIRRILEKNRLKVSQIDAAFPITGPLGATHAVRYVQRAIRFAKELGCPRVDTTDGARKPEGYSDEEVLAMTRQNYRQILAWADDYDITINVEPHGPYTTNPDTMARILGFFDSRHFGMNFDTGNTFIAGRDPVEFLKRFRERVNHVHVKDVGADLAAAARGEDTGIASSSASIGKGVNAPNIEKCIEFLKKTGWEGVFSIETLGTEENIRESVAWLRKKIG
jgi:inosose dehydratase